MREHAKNIEKGYFERRLQCAAPKHWSKCATDGRTEDNFFLDRSIYKISNILVFGRLGLCAAAGGHEYPSGIIINL